jgi:2-amino-4-hydroxy-6-hydroxymethyldihydropteridine diphosphokinase
MTSENELNQWDEAIIVGLGSNMPGHHDSSEQLLEAAIKALGAAGLKVVNRSNWRRSAAWPDPADPPFVNGVAIIEADLPDYEIMRRLHAIEKAFGRVRSVHNAPRTLDLDLIAHGRTVSANPQLPHPRAASRRFVMIPLAEIAPGWVHPVLNKTAAELARTANIG